MIILRGRIVFSGMTSEEFQHLRQTFDELLGASEQQRIVLIRDLNERNAPLANELQRMLAAYDRCTSFLDHSPVNLDAQHVETRLEVSDRVGSKIGPYVLEKELGRGGMGVVYQATRADGSFDKRVAIKILRRDRTGDLFLTRFQRERQILAQLNHPHIASVLDGGATAEGEPYFVMEYVDGEPVTTYCESRNLSLDRRLDLFLQICDAVQYAHRNLTVHRDLKPGNILVTEAGGVKLLDFGIAKLLQSDTDPVADAPATVAILTPEYASPEQIRREPVTTAVDVFALGIVLYEMTTGEHPFRRSARLPHEVMRAICEDDPPAPGALASRNKRQLGSELDAIILTALRKQPAWRYQSVEQLAEDVVRFRQGWPVLARGNGLGYRLRKFARRQWLPLTAAALLLLLLTGGILATAREARIAETARRAAEQSRVLAEEERAVADREKGIAQQQRLVATEQRLLAETRAKQVEMEQGKERARYQEVRSLASSLLFDLNDGIRDLAGSTTARRLIVSKAQQQLELLNRDSGRDVAVQRDLAASYERMGELRVDPRRPDKNDAMAALDACQHALELRRKIAAGPEATSRDRRDLVISLSKLGDAQLHAGDVKQGLASYQGAWDLVESLLKSQPQDAATRRTLGQVDERRCIGLLTAGKTAEAQEACREGIGALSELANALPNDVEIQRLLASTEGSFANALRLSRKPQEAAIHAKSALATLQRLEVLAPNNAEYRRLASTAETILATSLAATGDQEASMQAFRRSVQSMEIAVEIDPSDLGSPLRLAVTLLAFSRRLAAAKDDTGAHDTAREALQLLQRTVDKPGAGPVEWNEYADALLKVSWPDLREPAKALSLALKAVSSTNRKNPFFLDTLAWSYFRNGDVAMAVETEREALRLVPVDAQGGLHDELDRGLKTFLEGAPQ